MTEEELATLEKAVDILCREWFRNAYGLVQTELFTTAERELVKAIVLARENVEIRKGAKE